MSHPDELMYEKRFYQRFWALHNDPQLVAVFKDFGVRAFRRSSVLEGFDEFLRMHRVSGQRCIEIGTCRGLTAIVLARYFGEVVSFDIDRDPEKHAIAATLGVKNVVYVDVADNAEKASLIDALKFDFAYVDGDHARDTEEDFALVRRCGRVLFHEYWQAQPPVWNLVNRLRDAGRVVTQDKLALWTT